MPPLVVTVTYSPPSGPSVSKTVTATITEPPPAVRFPGDPGVGRLIMGVNDPPSTAQGSWQAVEAALPPPNLGAHRLYTNAAWALPPSVISSMQTAIGRGQIPIVSIGYNPFGSPAAVPQSAIDALAQQLLPFRPHPIMFIPGLHEPENDTPTTGTGQAISYDLTWAAAYRSTGRKLVTALRAAGCDHVTILGAAYMNCTASGGCPNRDWRWWHLDWRGTTSGAGGNSTPADWLTGVDKMVQVEAMDVYTPLIGSTNWVAPSTQMDTLLSAMRADGYTPGPLAILELGVKSDTADLTRGPAMMLDAYEGLIQRGGVAIIWWTTGGNSFNPGPTPVSDPDGTDAGTTGQRFDTLRQLVLDPRSFHL